MPRYTVFTLFKSELRDEIEAPSAIEAARRANLSCLENHDIGDATIEGVQGYPLMEFVVCDEDEKDYRVFGPKGTGDVYRK